MKNTTSFLLFLLTFSLFAQTNDKNKIALIENFILIQQQDSAQYYLNQVDKSKYTHSLQQIISSTPSYDDCYNFISKVGDRSNFSYQKLSKYINDEIKTPTNTKKIDLDFVKIKWLQVSKLRDETTIEAANVEQRKLDSYINQFESNDKNLQKARIYASTHQIVLYLIENKVKEGKDLCLSNLEKSIQLKDDVLKIMSLYYLCDFILLEGDLGGYIKICEEISEIESKRQFKTSYYLGNLIHTLDAYIYKGGQDEKILKLLQELYNGENTKDLSYSLYAKFLGNLNLNAPIAKNIFKQFEVNNLIEFSKKTIELGEETLNSHDLYQLLREASEALEKQGDLKEAIAVIKQSNVLIQKIYSQDLANSLAEVKTENLIKVKNEKLEIQRLKSTFYAIVIVFSMLLVLIIIYYLARNKRQRAQNNKKRVLREFK
ncbi:MAG: hypothetical protein COB73_02230 [Flavobacteriaceae bacterium]|nr:MAG: hypothetical protein COB73_02230 [Flavobacteriaceae bacterium]